MMSRLKDSLWYAIPNLVGTLMGPPISVPGPLGYVGVRERHRQLEPHLSNVGDLVRFTITLADDRHTDCLHAHLALG